LLDRPVSVAVKGPSSGGKSYVTESVLKLFPPSAFYALTAMSDRALAYSNEPLKHRHLVIYEAAGMSGEFATYLTRSLLSEGRLRYETVEKTKNGLEPKVIEREAPTGLIVTTTALHLHPENETRMLSLTVTDTTEQTASVFRALADEGRAEVDLTRWQALQTWLTAGSARVIVPFAGELAALVPPVAVRLRRDFKTVLTLIRAHALLHHATRRKPRPLHRRGRGVGARAAWGGRDDRCRGLYAGDSGFARRRAGVVLRAAPTRAAIVIVHPFSTTLRRAPSPSR